MNYNEISGLINGPISKENFLRGKYQGITLAEGDTFLFSSKTIPGNERGVIGIMNQLSEKGVDVVDDDSGLYHVSDHGQSASSQSHRLHALPQASRCNRLCRSA